MKNVRNVFLAIVFFLAAIAPATAASTPQVRLATGMGPVDFLFQLAVEKGFFLHHGVDVVLPVYKRGMDCVTRGVVQDKMEGAIVSTLVVAVQAFNYPNIFRIVAKIGASDTLDRILVRPESGVVSPRDLIGKKIAVPKGGTSHYFLVSYLEKWSIAPEDITLVYMNKKAMVQAMRDGEIDAVCQHDPVIGKIRKVLHGKGVEFGEDALARKTAVLVMRDDFSEGHPELVRGILRGLFDALEFFQSNRDEAAKIFARRKHFSLKEVETFLNDTFTVQISMPQSIMISLEQATLWAMQSGIVNAGHRIPSSLELVDYTFMESVKPEAVTIIH